MTETLKAGLGTAFGALLIFLTLVVPAMPQETTTGFGLVCDTEAQVLRYLALYKQGDDGFEVAQKVNAEAGKESACGIIPVVFYEVQEVSRTRGAAGPVKIVKVMVVSIQTPMGWLHVPPMEQYAVYPIKEEPA